MKSLEQNLGLNRSLKNLQTVVDELTAYPDFLKTATDPGNVGIRTEWARVYSIPALKAEIEASPTGELSLATLKAEIDFYNSTPSTYTGPAYTDDIANWVRTQLLKRVTADGLDTAKRISHLES